MFYIEKKTDTEKKKEKKKEKQHLIYTSFIPLCICSIMVKRLLNLSLQYNYICRQYKIRLQQYNLQGIK